MGFFWKFTTKSSLVQMIEGFKTVHYPLLDDPKGLKGTAEAISHFRDKWFDSTVSVVGTGTSGATLMTALAMFNTKDKYCIIAKKDELRSSHRCELSDDLNISYPIIVVDDRIEGGNTMRRIAEVLQKNDRINLVQVVCALNANHNEELLSGLFPKLKYIFY